ncbi:MAG: rhamnulokinase family protein [Terracidiphilus sp.]
MSANLSFVAVDLGASSGRVMDCRWDGARFELQELHRFPNAGVRVGESLHWDALRIWSEIQAGLMKFRALRNEIPAGIGVDAWGVDYALLDDRDRLLGNPYHYRDARTKGMPEKLSSAISGRDLFQATGVQTMEINTAFQLAGMVATQDGQLLSAQTLLMIPDFFAFLLCGAKNVEFTEATTTELYNLRARRWSRETMSALGIPAHIFPEVVMPSTVLGSLRPGLQADLGFAGTLPCIAVASHDTASAVAAIPDLDDSSVFLSSGTWSLIGVAVAEPNLSDEAFKGGFTNEGSADGGALLMKNLTGLWILQECVRMWEAAGEHHEWTELERAAADAAPFGAVIDPAASEFQAPADMRAEIRRYCADTNQPAPKTPGEIARCIFESLSFAYREAIDDLERIAGRKLHTVRLVGGGCLNRFLCQMIADACARTVIAGPAEAAALGNAVVQAVATGHLSSLAEGRAAVKESIEYRHFQPEKNRGWPQAFDHYELIVGLDRAMRKSEKEGTLRVPLKRRV